MHRHNQRLLWNCLEIIFTTRAIVIPSNICHGVIYLYVHGKKSGLTIKRNNMVWMNEKHTHRNHERYCSSFTSNMYTYTQLYRRMKCWKRRFESYSILERPCTSFALTWHLLSNLFLDFEGRFACEFFDGKAVCAEFETEKGCVTSYICMAVMIPSFDSWH